MSASEQQSQGTEIATPAKTKAIIQKYGFSLKKSLGQHFLTDQNILHKIAAAAELDEHAGAIEVGPGIGALTEQLARRAGKVVAVELDQRLIPILEDVMRPYDHVTVIHGDILKMDLLQLFSIYFDQLEHVSVVANLPYYVTTPIVMKFLEEKLPLRNMVVMIQKEVAERMVAKPGGKDYGSLSIAVQYYCEPEMIAFVPRTVFIPQPNVDSAIIKLKLRKHSPVELLNEDYFFVVMQACFAQRRKTIYNNLLARFFDKETKGQLSLILDRCGIDPVRRGETLSIQEFATLSNALLEYRPI